MNPFRDFLDAIQSILQGWIDDGTLPQGLPIDRISVEPPREPSHGDMACNAAMVLAKPAGVNPRDLAARLAATLAQLPEVAEAEVAGPGFLNLRLQPEYWQRQMEGILAAGIGYGDSDLGKAEPVNIEYVSANPTGPMHIGHTRGAVVGDALAALLAKAGYAVTKEYYINDAGAQVDALARSAFLRYREALGEDIGEMPAGLYPGDYLVPVGQVLAEAHGESLKNRDEAEWLPVVRDVAIDAMMVRIKADLAALGVQHDVFSSERELVEAGAVDRALAALEAKGLIYTGVLEPPKGKLPEDWEERPQTLFRATEFGDDVDRPMKKSDGSWTYFATDVAYHYDKVRRGAKTLIDVMGADHGGYVKRVTASVKALTDGKAVLDVKLCQLVRLMRQGEQVRMSKRSGDFVTLRELVDDVGRDVVRFIMLTRKNDAPLDFDLDKVVEESRDNPVFYVQYAHARAHSVLRHAAGMFGADAVEASVLAQADLSPLSDEDELGLIKILASWPRVVEQAAIAHEPHRIAFYLGEVAAAFHALWNKGRDNTTLRFIQQDEPHATKARLAMVAAMATVIGSGLRVMGVTPRESM
ncbi:MAG TPA: arginine--tRNA ligase [Alphaproteobacteria bacterium]|nr:arginine--tRNA ligase [Alphaproteobacteria bacterium]